MAPAALVRRPATPHIIGMKKIVLAMLAFGLIASPAGADDPRQRLGAAGAEPLRFRAANGGAFAPLRVVLATGDAALARDLPDTARARSEDRIDFSGLEGVGGLFAPRLAPGDAAQGVRLGPVRRVGGTLVVHLGPLAAAALAQVTGAPLVLTADLPRLGTVSYALGRAGWQPAEAPAGGEIVGTAWLAEGSLVVAAAGAGPLIDDWGALFRGN